MLNTAFVRSNALTVGFTAFVSVGSLLATASSTLATSVTTIDFGTWGRVGDSVFTPPPPPGGQVDVQSGFNPWFSSVTPGTTPGTISNTPAASIAQLNTFLGSSLTGTTGSALKSTVNIANAGDVFKFSYFFANGENQSAPGGATNDYAFFTVNGTLVSQFVKSSDATTLGFVDPTYFTGSKDGTYQYTFAAPGTYTIGLGVVSAGVTANAGLLGSGLGLSNGSITTVPAPAPLLGVIGMGAAQAVKRMRKKQEA